MKKLQFRKQLYCFKVDKNSNSTKPIRCLAVLIKDPNVESKIYFLVFALFYMHLFLTTVPLLLERNLNGTKVFCSLSLCLCDLV